MRGAEGVLGQGGWGGWQHAIEMTNAGHAHSMHGSSDKGFGRDRHCLRERLSLDTHGPGWMGGWWDCVHPEKAHAFHATPLLSRYLRWKVRSSMDRPLFQSFDAPWGSPPIPPCIPFAVSAFNSLSPLAVSEAWSIYRAGFLQDPTSPTFCFYTITRVLRNTEHVRVFGALFPIVIRFGHLRVFFPKTMNHFYS